MEFYGPIIGKFILGMLCIILQINIVGKRNLAPVTALDQVQNYVLGGIIGGIIYNQDITVLQFLMVLIIWTLVVMVDGRPAILVKNGKLDVETCLKRGVTADELMFRLRVNEHGSNGLFWNKMAN